MQNDHESKKMEINALFKGPYAWPKYEAFNGLNSIPKHPGLYLQTVEHKNGYLIYCAGITRRSMPIRFREHTKKYLSGDYTVLDIISLQTGIREEVWHGWGWNPGKIQKFESNKTAIIDAVHKQLAGFRIFVADIGTEPRILERMEAAVMKTLYQSPTPFCDIPDRGMQLSPRRNSETSIVVRRNCSVILHGFPPEIEI